MKKALSILIIVALIICGVGFSVDAPIVKANFLKLSAYLTISEDDISIPLDRHWAKDMVSKEFIQTYFNYLFNSNSEFKPDSKILKGIFLTSLFSLSEFFSHSYFNNEQNINSEMISYFTKMGIIDEDNFNYDEKLTRKEAVKLIVDYLGICDINDKIDKSQNSFIDLEDLREEYVTAILNASNMSIVKGYPNNTFVPNKSISQIEAILLLQRVKEWREMNSNPRTYKIINNDMSNDIDDETLQIKEKNDKVCVTITKMFPTSGYNMTIKEVKKSINNILNVYIEVQNPAPNMRVLHVITYKRINLEFDKKDLDNTPYKIKVIFNDIDLPKLELDKSYSKKIKI